ncbi:site-specific integrase [Novilysobacter arseniciresistens]|nr:site-specific integrase [Lysobacter arseniciresistens]
MPTITRLPLTRAKVEAAKPEPSPYWLRDATVPGLALRVLPSGKRTYSVLWGRGRAKAVGDHPVMTLEGARTTARKLLAEIAEHGAPLSTLQRRQADRGLTWGRYLADHYGPHVEATAKAGAATLASLRKQFAEWDDKLLTSITRADFDAVKVKRIKQGRTPATINRDLDRAKAALSKAEEWDLLPVNPLRGVKRIKREIGERVRYLEPKEEKRLRMALDRRERAAQEKRLSGDAWRKVRRREPLGAFKGYSDHLAPMVLVAINTGLRRGELLQLTWADVDLRAKRVTVQAGYAKSGKARHVPLNSEAAAVLKRWKQQRKGDGLVFPGAGGGRMTNINKSWAGLVEAAELEGFRFHDLRHTFASKLVMAEIDLNTVRELLGHGDIKMTLRYAHLAPAHRAAAVEVLVGR